MSNIIFNDKGQATALFCDYKHILQSKISDVCKKIQFDDSKIQWIIFDPKKNAPSYKELLVGLSGKDYGFCNPYKNLIYISTLTLEQSAYSAKSLKYNSLLKLEKNKNDFLANVIIDEITHIQTKKNHGTPEYDDKFEENAKKYYYDV